MCLAVADIQRSIAYNTGCIFRDLYSDGSVVEQGTTRTALHATIKRFLNERVDELDGKKRINYYLIEDFAMILFRIKDMKWDEWKLWSFANSYMLELIDRKNENNNELYWI